MTRPRTLLVGILLWSLAPLTAASAGLPVTPYPAVVDGDPREAFLLGAARLPMHDPMTGAPDGSVRAFALATREGLYVAVLSTDLHQGERLACAGGRPVPGGETGSAAPWAMDPEDTLPCDWMAVRFRTGRDLLFFLAPDGKFTSTRSDGATPGLDSISWIASASTFGHTWAGEWLLPWESLGLRAGDRFVMEVLRGRKLVAGRQALEVLSSTSPYPSASRWGGEGIPLTVPAFFGSPIAKARALAPFDVRPFLPDEFERPHCVDAVPAGEVATAWIELPPSATSQRVTVEGFLAAAEAFGVDFWWQAGTREEQDALFPARVAQGLGDTLVAERLFPQGGAGFPPSPWTTRVYVRCRVPMASTPGTRRCSILVRRESQSPETLFWEVRIAPPLPPAGRLAGLYYGERDPSRWIGDLVDMAAHGFNAVTCPSKSEDGWKRFVAEARERGLQGAFAMSPELPAVPEAWAYTVDEPSTEAAFSKVREISRGLRSRGFRSWTALCWPNSLSLAKELDGYALSPGLVEPALQIGLTGGRWTYVQGLREEPAYNRLMAGVFSHAGGMTGFWVFCYVAGDERSTDWTHPYYRHDACVENGPGGARIQTVQWEALREGILDSRLREALGEKAGDIEEEFPVLRPVLRGRYWEMDREKWDFERHRNVLVEKWSVAARTGRPVPGAASPGRRKEPVRP